MYCIAHVRPILHGTRSPRVHPRGGEPDYTPMICLNDFYFLKSLNIIFCNVVDLTFKYYFLLIIAPQTYFWLIIKCHYLHKIQIVCNLHFGEFSDTVLNQCNLFRFR